MYKHDVINFLINKYEYKSYLEIGTANKNCFNNIVCHKKICVDPEKNNEIYDYNMTSDEFFLCNKDTFDVIFIDGLHLAEQVEKDIANSKLILNNNGKIILHDTNPGSEFFCLENNYQNNPVFPGWNGTVWKAIYSHRMKFPTTYLATYPHDHGLTIISPYKKDIMFMPKIMLNKYYSYYIFNTDRHNVLNITENLDDL